MPRNLHMGLFFLKKPCTGAKYLLKGFGIWGMPSHVHTTAHAYNIREVQKMHCLIQKASRCAADCMSKTIMLFIFHFLYNTKIFGENHVYLFFISLFQWWKLHYIFIFFTYIKKELKRNMNDGTIIFLTSLLIILTRKILLLFSFWYKIISCFK